MKRLRFLLLLSFLLASLSLAQTNKQPGQIQIDILPEQQSEPREKRRRRRDDDYRGRSPRKQVPSVQLAPTPSDSRRVTSAAVGGLVGLGLGHAIQERYWQDGWAYTAIDAAGFIGVAAGGGAFGVCDGCGRSTYASIGLGILLLSRIFAVTDLLTYVNLREGSRESDRFVLRWEY